MPGNIATRVKVKNGTVTPAGTGKISFLHFVFINNFVHINHIRTGCSVIDQRIGLHRFLCLLQFGFSGFFFGGGGKFCYLDFGDIVILVFCLFCESI